MSHKTPKIRALVRRFEGQPLDARYLGYFACFNRQEFYEAHDVLEDLWLEQKGAPDSDFYKALIQFAGAFVHLQKGRLRPAATLFRLSSTYLARFPSPHHQLDLVQVRALASAWAARLSEGNFLVNPLPAGPLPLLLPIDIRIASLLASQ